MKQTALEKAKSLIEKFRQATSFEYQEYAGAHYTTFEHDNDELIKCALVYVEEIFENLNSIFSDLDEMDLGIRLKGRIEIEMDFYNDVKTELENLK